MKHKTDLLDNIKLHYIYNLIFHKLRYILLLSLKFSTFSEKKNTSL